MINNLIYVYCISNQPLDLILDAEFEGLRCVKHGTFNTIVKMVPETEFSESNFRKNLSNINWVSARARSHMKIIGLLMEQCTVIPFKFGTIYHTEEGLKRFIEEYSDSLIENLDFIKNKVEWSVKIYCDRKALSSRIDKLSKGAAEMEKQILASSPGKAFLLKRKKEGLVKNEMDRLCKEYGQSYFNEFENMSEKSSLNNIIPNEMSGRKDTMILNANFLIKKDKSADFTNAVRRMNEKDENPGFFIETTGPWPPFNFVFIKL